MAQNEAVNLIRNELERVESGIRLRRAVLSAITVLLLCSAAAVIMSVFLFPVIRVYGGSMSPSVSEGDVVTAVRTGSASQGDLVAFYYGNKVLVKRCIAVSGDLVDIDGGGYVFVNGTRLSWSGTYLLRLHWSVTSSTPLLIL